MALCMSLQCHKKGLLGVCEILIIPILYQLSSQVPKSQDSIFVLFKLLELQKSQSLTIFILNVKSREDIYDKRLAMRREIGVWKASELDNI